MGFANKLTSNLSNANSEADLVTHVSNLVTKIAGIQLGEKQKSMVESRMKKRMIELQIKTDEEYLDYLDKNQEEETKNLLSLLTTHHTYFFRESAQFDYLEKKGLQTMVDGARSRKEKTLRFWSAASSTGQEVYTLGMFLKFHLKTIAPDFTFEIVGSDVDSKSVETARNGVYQFAEIKEIPLQYTSGNWQKGTGEISNFARVKDDLKKHIQFETQNLLSINFQSTGLKGKKFDAIFCRNVFIYFTPQQIEQITSNLVKVLQPSGNLFLGISETLSTGNLPIKLVGSSIYAFKDFKAALPQTSPTANGATKPTSTNATTGVSIPDVLKVVCVDDSPTILTMLKKILTKDAGYEIVGTAMNGLEARELLKTVKADVMTLDIHMPEQTGLEYLKANAHSANHPAVVMISSVSREDSDLALNCLESGAFDYVEKPAMSNIAERSDEIRLKLRGAFRAQRAKAHASLSLDKSFSRHQKIENPEQTIRLLFASASDTKRMGAFFKEIQNPQPNSFVFFEGSESALQALVKKCSKEFGKTVKLLSGNEKEAHSTSQGTIYLADFKKEFDGVYNVHSKKKTSILVYGDVTKASADKIKSWKNANILAEDLKAHGGKPGSLEASASDVVPVTSFGYMSTEFLARKT